MSKKIYISNKPGPFTEAHSCVYAEDADLDVILWLLAKQEKPQFAQYSNSGQWVNNWDYRGRELPAAFKDADIQDIELVSLGQKPPTVSELVTAALNEMSEDFAIAALDLTPGQLIDDVRLRVPGKRADRRNTS